MQHNYFMSKCLEKGIKIYPVPVSTGAKSKVKIIVDNGGKIQEGKELYDQKKVHLKITELYEHFYKFL